MHPALTRIGDLVLGTERKVRLRVTLAMIAFYGYSISSLLLLFAIDIGLVARQQGLWLLTYIWVGMTTFYVLVRTDWSSRLGNPGMDLPQCLYATVAILWAYMITGEVRSSVLMLVALVLVFGMFSLKAREVVILGIFTVVSLGIIMAVMAMHNPHIDARLEFIRFVLAAGTLPAVSGVAYYVSQMRARLIAQKGELAHALALLQEVASRDELTRLVNRRHMQQRIEEAASMQLRSHEPFCLALIDLDHFKRVNDLHGHATGDQVLKEFAVAALQALRQTDVLARWGGEEFLLLLPNEQADSAQAALTRIAKCLRTHQHGPGASGLPVTFSAGLTNHPSGEPLRETLERADQALYAAKAQGRNRTVAQLAPAMAQANTLADARQV
ncbi:diguanylate cyclase [Aquabacterium sp.]|uniref:diguanylate cyclase domain-containing protein n=1 Tax=Aquabacterium sp. TaxID=1872578 RepID=UPI001984A11A|nr:diguanylate cyclase [Aquabacterium sp.]MBC7699913.1 GGDEF domain-containing protein [Aquabacterium sp.]